MHLYTRILAQTLFWNLAFHQRHFFSSGGYWFPHTLGAAGPEGKADVLYASLLIPLSCNFPPIYCHLPTFSHSQRLWHPYHVSLSFPSLSIILNDFNIHKDPIWFTSFLAPRAPCLQWPSLPLPQPLVSAAIFLLLLLFLNYWPEYPASNQNVYSTTFLIQSFALIRTLSSWMALLSFLSFPYPA